MANVSRKTILLAAGGALVLVALALKLVVLHPKGAPASIPVAAPVHHALARPHHKAPSATRSRRAHEPNALPASLRTALGHKAVVVAVLFAAGTIDDEAALAEAREGAKAAHAGFAVLNVRQEGIARTLAQTYPGLSDPSVLVYTRPGNVAVQLPGYADAEMVAQAAADARP
jgi:hypothetical protein